MAGPAASVLRSPRTQPPALKARARPEFSVESPAAGQTVLTGVSWTAYEQLLKDRGPRGPRFIYDHGNLAIMTHGKEHEDIRTLLVLFVELLIMESDVSASNLGNLTVRDSLRKMGFEPDSCFYFSNLDLLAKKKELDFKVDPAPDLIIEIDITRSSVPRESIYSAFKVKELWRHNGSSLNILHLNKRGKYISRPSSQFFPGLTAAMLDLFLDQRESVSPTPLKKKFAAWARDFATRAKKT